ncbi:MAG: ABC transporter permease [Cyclobacteriaceae bacterium]|nr:ABC transporter permease [Cyclobacteriaceae bacterium]
MLTNFLRVAFRNLVKQRIYTLINIIGLAVSITACLLIMLYVRHETSYDDFVPEGDRVYKLGLERKYPNHSTFYAAVPDGYAGAMRRDFPEVESTLHLLGPTNDVPITYEIPGQDAKTFEEDNIYFADSTFFEFFPVTLIKGDPKTALSVPNQIIVSRAVAERFFGAEDPLNKTLKANFGEFKVTGVFEQWPENSHVNFEMMASFNAALFFNQENYISFNSHLYLKLRPGSDARALEAKFPQMVDQYASAQIERELRQSWEDYKKAGNGYRYFLQPLTSIHLDPTNLEFTTTPSGNSRYVLGLSLIAALILVIACINFMNLATARSASRAREVGMRKVMGSMKGQLVAQFLLESIILAVVSTFLAVVAAYLLLPAFNLLVEKNLAFIVDAAMILALAGFALFVGALAGIYPAFVLSSFNPVEVMKGSFSRSRSGLLLRNGLVVFQFMISVFLIVATLVVGRQMHFMQNKDLGFNKESVLMIDRAFQLQQNTEPFLNKVRTMPEVVSAARTSARVGNRDDVFGQMFQPVGSNEVLTVKSMVIDDEFAPAIGFTMKEGRFFSRETSDSLNILLNETAVKTLGLKDPVGQRLTNSDLFRGNPELQKERIFTIIGIVSNFHFQSLRDEITPLVIFNYEIFNRNANSNFIAVRIKEERQQEAIRNLEGLWKELVPTRPFKYEFLEDNLNQGYAQERQSGQVFRVFSGLAIIIACVGLFGLSAFTAGQRTKEIGIRKVLGASVPGVVLLLSRDFTKLVLIALGLAIPLAWYLMDSWLSGFAYRISIGVDSFLIAGLVSLGIAWLTVSYQSIKAAIVNPVNSLRRE